MSYQDSSDAVTGVLAQMDRQARMGRMAIFGAVAVEGLLMMIAPFTFEKVPPGLVER